MSIDAAERARRAAAAMWAEDAASQWLGIRLEEVAPGRAVASFEVREHHVNGHGICHGGLIFTLADTAFAFACNSYNQRAVAQHNTISYLTPGRLGERLVAEAVETAREGRSGIYDVTVRGGDGRVVATFRGASRTIGGTHFDEDEEEEKR